MNKTTVFCAVIVLAISAAAPCQEDTGELIKLITEGASTDAERAEKLITAASDLESETAVKKALYSRAYDYGITSAAGYDFALQALDKLADIEGTDPADIAEKRLVILRKRYANAPPARRAKAGMAFVEGLVAAGDRKFDARRFTEAAGIYREAIRISTALGLAGLHDELNSKIKQCGAMKEVEKKAQDLEKKLRADPADAETRKQLVMIHVVEYDDPAAAAKLLTEDLDLMLQTCVKLAAADPASLQKDDCMELARWYAGLAEKAAGDRGKINTMVRAKNYYERAMKAEDVKSLDKLKIKIALKKLKKELDELGYVPDDRLPPKKWLDLFEYTDFDSPYMVGKIVRENAAVSMAPLHRSAPALPVPVMPTAGYRIQFKVRWTGDYPGMYLSLPVGTDCQTGFGISYRECGFNLRGSDWGAKANPANKRLPDRLESGKIYLVELEVMRTGDKIAMAAALNRRKLLQWRGSVSTHMQGTSPRNRTLTFHGNRYGTTVIGDAGIMITEGEGVIPDPKDILAIETKQAEPITNTEEPIRKEIPARGPWHPVGLVEEKEYYTVRAKGGWEYSAAKGAECGPSGTRAGKYYLQARIGDGTPFKIGEEKQFQATASGLLQLGMGGESGAAFADNNEELRVYYQWDRDRRPRPLTAAKTMRVPVGREWTDFGFVDAGKQYRISTDDERAWRVNGEKMTANGEAGRFYLQARIDGGDPFRVGTDKLFTAKTGGLLELGMSHWDEKSIASGAPPVTVEPWEGPAIPDGETDTPKKDGETKTPEKKEDGTSWLEELTGKKESDEPEKAADSDEKKPATKPDEPDDDFPLPFK